MRDDSIFGYHLGQLGVFLDQDICLLQHSISMFFCHLLANWIDLWLETKVLNFSVISSREISTQSISIKQVKMLLKLPSFNLINAKFLVRINLIFLIKIYRVNIIDSN